MMKRIIAGLLGICLLIALPAGISEAGGSGVDWTRETRAGLRIGNPTALRGRFFTTMWGGTAGDLDVQELLHGYSPVLYDTEMNCFRFDHSVIRNAAAADDSEGNRTYTLVFYDDLLWSDGTPVTAADYAFSILFCMDPAIAETGGKATDYSWISGAEEYLDHTSPTLSGLRIISDRILKITVKAEALPYFYELGRLAIYPYPASVIAPGVSMLDEGDGARLSEPLTAKMITEYVLDPDKGYLSHPSVVSGPYTVTAYEWPTARLNVNPYYKGNEKGMVPRIGEVEYTLADNRDMVEKLAAGEFGLLKTVTLSGSISDGLRLQAGEDNTFAAANYPRTGLTMIRFLEGSVPLQEAGVRKAIACCFDRENYIRDYIEPYGQQTDGLYGFGHWTYRLASGQMETPVDDQLPEEEYEAAAAAFDGLNLDGLTRYTLDTEEAVRLLEDAGWTLNGQGIRSRTINGEEVPLQLKLGFPESREVREGLEMYFIPYLAKCGIQVSLNPLGMEDVEKAYRGETDDVDMLYVGEDFFAGDEQRILAPARELTGEETGGSLTAALAELHEMAGDMNRTGPDDTAGYMRKWIALQERITETLPLLPVYSNEYYDFYSRELHNYRITREASWGKAILESYISDIGETEETK